MTFAAIVLYSENGRAALGEFSSAVQNIINFSNEGISFLFGGLVSDKMFELFAGGGFIMAFRVLPVVVFFSAFVAVLYYLGIMQLLVGTLGRALSKMLGTSRAESISATANIFLGISEAPLTVRPYIARMTRSELFAVMVGGMASVAGSVLVGYSQMGIPLEYLLAASFMAAPAGLMMAKLLIPETEQACDSAESAEDEKKPANIIDAAAQGALQGMQLALNIGAMLLAFISLIAMLNALLGWAGSLAGFEGLSLDLVFGYLFLPFANIAHGNSSIIADRIALKLSEFTVTEGGFGSDMGFEKACNIKAQQAGRGADCAVVVATLRGLKANSGLYDLRPGQALPDAIFDADEKALIAGFDNLKWHINNAAKYGVPVVVAINRFPQDSDAELNQLKEMIANETFDTYVDVALSEAFGKGGEGAVELAHAVVKACETPANFKPLYQLSQPLEEKLMAVAEVGYGCRGVELSELAKQQLAELKAQGHDNLAVCMAKTPLSISHDPSIKGAPSDFIIPVRELKLCAGAGFVYALCGNVMTMPGLPEKPAFMNLDIDADGNIIGLS